MHGKGAPFNRIANGVPGLEIRLPMLFSAGVGAGRISLNRFVDLCCTRPAKLYGLYPRKGSIAVGGDADIAIWDPERTVTISQDMLHDNLDYTPYEGRVVTGWPVTTLSRGAVVWDDGDGAGRAGPGRVPALRPAGRRPPPGPAGPRLRAGERRLRRRMGDGGCAMSRIVTVAAAQLGPIARDEPRASVVQRMIVLMREAAGRGADLVVYPELALTTFFPRWLLDDAEVDAFFEAEMPGSRDPAALRGGRRPRRRLPPRLCRARAGRRGDSPLQHGHPGGSDGYRSSASTAKSTCRVTRSTSPNARVPAPGEALFRGGQPRLPGVGGARRPRRHADLQRPALARGLPRAGPAGRGTGADRLQHAGAERPRLRAAAPARLPQPPHHAGRRIPERHLGGGRRQGGARGRRRHAGRQRHRLAQRRDRGAGPLGGRRGCRRRLRSSTTAPSSSRAPSTSRPTAVPSTTA